MPHDIDDDEYVAKLLAQDAKKSSKTYDLVGLDAFNSKRSKMGAPKPNTNFLRHIIRQTDSHNAALLAKEAEESSSRLRQLTRERAKDRTAAVDRVKRRIEGRLSPPPNKEDSQSQHSRSRHSSRRDDRDRDGDDRRRERKSNHRHDRSTSRSKRHRDGSRSRQGHKRRHSSDDDRNTKTSRRPRPHPNDDHRSRHDTGRDYKKSRDSISHGHSRGERRTYSSSPSRSRSRSRSRSPRHKSHRKHDRSRSPRRSPKQPSSGPRKSRKDTQGSPSTASDSDPLEAIVGPLPPPAEPSVRSRGRGALKASSMGIESRFSSTYDPSMDMKPGSDGEDDWDEALEVMRDRERWKQQGADRLRAAGFKDEQVSKWEKGGDPMEEDVVWSKKGQGREWDRGKVVDDEGNVELKAEWGRLK